MDQTRAEHMRKTLTAVSMVLAPLCFVVSDLLWPVTHTKAADVLADATGSTGAVYTAMVFGLLGMVFMMGAVLGLAHMLHERRPGMAMTGAGLALIGILGIAGGITGSGLVLFEAAQPKRDTAAMVSLIHDLYRSAVPILIVTLLLSVGVVVMAVGLYMARVVAQWSAALIGIAAVAIGICQPLAFKPGIVIADVVLLAGLGSIGWTVLAETDEEWEHTPQFHGFARPAMG